MREYRFHHVDVFADGPLAGNPLAVFPEAGGLSDAEMQGVARELHLSETTFVLPPTDPAAAYRVRIFTPGRELPFAGHPIVGTAWVMAREGKVPLRATRTELRQQVGIGTLPVTLETEPDPEVPGGGRLRVARVVMTQGAPCFSRELGAKEGAALAAALGGPAGGVGHPGLPPQVVSTGLDELLVPLQSVEAVATLSPDLLAVRRLVEEVCAVGLYAFALLPPGGTDSRASAQPVPATLPLPSGSARTRRAVRQPVPWGPTSPPGDASPAAASRCTRESRSGIPRGWRWRSSREPRAAGQSSG